MERARFERYAEVLGWDTRRKENGYYESPQMNDFWAVWMGCIEFETEDE